MINTKKDSLKLVEKTIKTDVGVKVEKFELTKNEVIVIKELKGRRKFPIRKNHLQLITFGGYTIFSTVSEHQEWIKEHLLHLDRDALYSIDTLSKLNNYMKNFGAVMCGPDIKLTCDKKSFKPFLLKNEYQIEMVYDVEQLYKHKGFDNALSYNPKSLRKDRIAVVAKHNDEVIGVSCATEDSMELYQIGIEVLDDYKGMNIGKTLVSILTEQIFGMGKLPYYSTTLTNLSSRNIAISLGYYPAWIEIYSR